MLFAYQEYFQQFFQSQQFELLLLFQRPKHELLFNNEEISTNLLFFCFDYGNKYLSVDFLNHEKWKKIQKLLIKRKKETVQVRNLQNNKWIKNKNNKMIKKATKKSLKWAYSIFLNSFKVNIGYFLQQVLKPFCFM